MKIVLFTHPSFWGSKSMPRFTDMLEQGLKKKGHDVTIYAPKKYFFGLPAPSPIKKWFGYIDQFIIFPLLVKMRVKNLPNSLYVFTDHALGMWVPIVKHLPHVIICHDFLAQKSAAGEILQNPTSKTGVMYQKLIRDGYSQGSNFISISKKTQQDLHRFLGRVPSTSEVVYNGLNKQFSLINTLLARQKFESVTGLNVTSGYVLHVGGNQWYKNRVGVVGIYNAWRTRYASQIPLLLVGESPSVTLQTAIAESPFNRDIHIVTNLNDDDINACYSGATVLLFPSLAEGFGWPIAEAMASGCPVITTNEAPMTEVGGDSAFYVSAQPEDITMIEKWAIDAASVLDKVVNLSVPERLALVNDGLANIKRFDTSDAINHIERILQRI